MRQSGESQAVVKPGFAPKAPFFFSECIFRVDYDGSGLSLGKGTNHPPIHVVASPLAS